MPVQKKSCAKRRINGSKSGTFTSILAPNAPFSYVEAYKTLRTNLDFAASSSKAKCILVTSALPDESKSTVSINIALSMADSGKSVALVECDLRKPTLRRYLRLNSSKLGLSSVLSGAAVLEECIQVIPEKTIAVIAAGVIPPNPSELLNQERMCAVIHELKEQYDYVILDAPPISVVTDAAVVGRMADGALLVVRSRYAPTRLIRTALGQLQAMDIRVLGAVVTRLDTKKSAWRSGYHYGDYRYGYN